MYTRSHTHTHTHTHTHCVWPTPHSLLFAEYFHIPHALGMGGCLQAEVREDTSQKEPEGPMPQLLARWTKAVIFILQVRKERFGQPSKPR